MGGSPVDVIAAPRILLGGQLVGPGWVRAQDGDVVACGRGAPADLPTIELPRGVLAPGLVDMQINGAYGHDLASADLAGWREISLRLPETGVTAYAPTIITAPMDELAATIARYRELRPEIDAAGGARTIGLHCEGPFLAEERRGAHRAEFMLDPAPEHIDTLLTAADGSMAYVTLAPERTGAVRAVRDLVAAGVRVAVGHSDATDGQVAAAADAGASLVTHLFNAQRPLRHRDPGVVGAALADPRLTVGMIVDLHHVAATAVRVAFAAAAGRLALVTDAVAALGMSAGTYELGGQVTTVREHAPPVRDDGALAGSVLRLDEAVANAVACGVDPATALTAATRVPADAVGRSDLGRLSPGLRADLVWLDDDWRAIATWAGGNLVHVDRDRVPAGSVPGLVAQ